MSEETRDTSLSKGTLVMCRLGERTKIGPCRVVFVGSNYVTVEDPDQNVWQTTLDRVERADDQLSSLLNPQV